MGPAIAKKGPLRPRLEIYPRSSLIGEYPSTPKQSREGRSGEGLLHLWQSAKSPTTTPKPRPNLAWVRVGDLPHRPRLRVVCLDRPPRRPKRHHPTRHLHHANTRQMIPPLPSSGRGRGEGPHIQESGRLTPFVIVPVPACRDCRLFALLGKDKGGSE